MSRRWHLEHADGRWWTGDELDELAARLRERTRIGPFDESCFRVCIDRNCDPWLLGDWGGYYFADDPDCKVVWDG